MQTDDIIFSAIETCAVAEVHDNFELAIKTERDNVQGKLEDSLCSTPVPEIVINIEKLFQDVTENDAVNKSMEISSQEWGFSIQT